MSAAAKPKASVDSSPVISSVNELSKRLALVDVHLLEVAAKRRQDENLQPTSDEDRQHREHKVLVGESDDTVQVRVVSTLEVPQADFTFDLVAVFTKDGEFEIPDNISKDFIEEIGLPALWPYLREAIHESSAKLRIPRVILPVLAPHGKLAIADEPPAGKGS